MRALVLGALVSAACGGDLPPPITVSDSAGVRITLSVDASRTFARVDPQPVLQVGGASATGAPQFHQVMGVYLDAMGRLWVADGQSNELRIFTPEGTHWKTRGGAGEGPGEFLRIRLLGAFRGDSVALGDNANGRVTVYDREGELARTVRLPSVDDATPLPRAVFEDGSILAQLPRILRAEEVRPDQVLADTVRLVRVGADEDDPRDRITAEGPLWLWTGRSQVPVPFTVNADYAVAGDDVHLVTGPAFRVRVFTSGRLAESYGVIREARRVGDSDVDDYRSYVQEFVPDRSMSDYIGALDHASRPELLPAYAGLLAADDTVWARRYTPDPVAAAVWDVFDESRVWLGTVETPARFLASSIRDGLIAGIWLDELGVEHLRVYRVVLE